MNLPTKINVSRVITYDTARVLEIINEDTGVNPSEISLNEILERIEEWAAQDFGCDWGHTVRVDDLIYQDQNGEEL